MIKITVLVHALSSEGISKNFVEISHLHTPHRIFVINYNCSLNFNSTININEFLSEECTWINVTHDEKI